MRWSKKMTLNQVRLWTWIEGTIHAFSFISNTFISNTRLKMEETITRLWWTMGLIIVDGWLLYEYIIALKMRSTPWSSVERKFYLEANTSLLETGGRRHHWASGLLRDKSSLVSSVFTYYHKDHCLMDPPGFQNQIRWGQVWEKNFNFGTFLQIA